MCARRAGLQHQVMGRVAGLIVGQQCVHVCMRVHACVYVCMQREPWKASRNYEGAASWPQNLITYHHPMFDEQTRMHMLAQSTSASVHPYTHTDAHTPTHAHTPTSTRTPTHPHPPTHSHVHTPTNPYIHVHTHLHAHVHMHTYTHAFMSRLVNARAATQRRRVQGERPPHPHPYAGAPPPATYTGPPPPGCRASTPPRMRATECRPVVEPWPSPRKQVRLVQRLCGRPISSWTAREIDPRPWQPRPWHQALPAALECL